MVKRGGHISHAVEFEILFKDSSTVNWQESPDPLVPGMVTWRSCVPLSLFHAYYVPNELLLMRFCF